MTLRWPSIARAPTVELFDLAGPDLLEISILTIGTFDIVSGPAQMVSLTSNVPLPAAAGTMITWTAGATGGTRAARISVLAAERRHLDPGAGLQPAEHLHLADDGRGRRQHAVQARVRSIGSANPYEAQMTSGTFQIN